MNLLKKAKQTFYLSIICIPIVVLIIVFPIIMSSMLLNPSGFNTTNSILLLVFVIILSLSLLTINIVMAVNILATDWKNQKLNDSKIIWGILTLILLGWIASLVFSCMAISELNKNAELPKKDQDTTDIKEWSK